jgi:hypothetical protein
MGSDVVRGEIKSAGDQGDFAGLLIHRRAWIVDGHDTERHGRLPFLLCRGCGLVLRETLLRKTHLVEGDGRGRCGGGRRIAGGRLNGMRPHNDHWLAHADTRRFSGKSKK